MAKSVAVQCQTFPHNIVIRNGKIIGKVVCFEYYLRLNLSFGRYYYPGYFRIHQHLMWHKIKTTAFFMWPPSWSTNISSFYYSDIYLLLIDYTCCKQCNIWLLLFRNKPRSYYYTGVSNSRKSIAAVITQDGIIDDNLKRQIKNRTLYACRLFLLTRIF